MKWCSRKVRPALRHRKVLLLWVLYDFSTTIVIIVFLIYFSQWLVVENYVGDLWYNLIFVAASLLLFLTVPLASVIADKRNNRVFFLRVLTLLQFCFFLLTGCTAAYFPHTRSTILAAGIFYLAAVYCHQFALVFYNALLPDVAITNAIGMTSGFGQAAKSLGTVAGILLSLPFAHGSFRFLGYPGRSQTFLPVTLIAMLLAVPCLLLREPERKSGKHTGPLRWHEYGDLLRQLSRQPGVLPFLVGFFLFTDAILTIQDNLPIYMQRVLMIPDNLKSLFIAAGLLAAAVGALIGGRLGDKLGLKNTLVGALAAWTVLLLCLAAVQRAAVFGFVATLIGVIFGMTWTVSRALMARMAPPDQLTHAFGYYSIVERFSTFCGPLVWGGIVTALSTHGADRYRIALRSMIFFILLGLLMVSRIPRSMRGPSHK